VHLFRRVLCAYALGDNVTIGLLRKASGDAASAKGSSSTIMIRIIVEALAILEIERRWESERDFDDDYKCALV
jgi:hypothetical protein